MQGASTPAVLVERHFLGSAETQRLAAERCVEPILSAARLIVGTFRSGGKLLLCGNGGSAADCQHVAAEFVNRLASDLERPGLPAVALTTDTSFLTAYANDCGFDGVFERQVRALGRAGDLLMAVSTSGTSRNVVRAVRAARDMGLETVGLVGERGELAAQVGCAIVVPSRNTQHVQETLLVIEHIICGLVEQSMFGRGEVRL